MAKDVNVELNLTPFIGLFALLVVLLIVTAAWNKIVSHSTNTSSTTSGASTQPPKKEVQLSITIFTDKVSFAEDQKAQSIPILNSNIDKDLVKARLREWRNKYPKKKDVVLNTDNKIPYRHLMEVFDLLVGENFPDVGVSTQ